MLFDTPDVRNRGIFVKKSFSEPHQTKKIAEHNCFQYHNDAMEKKGKFQDAYEARNKDVHYNPNNDIKFADNQHILQEIIEAVVLCVEQNISLHN